tara:strand:- start:303 stop:1178 length:876 start_codon:yes stop_codon:yes gene_type:complete
MNTRKGIILAGGKGSRLSPLTYAISKQLLPLYNKPMIYYPLSTLMLSGIKEYLIITTPNDKENFRNLLSNGNQWGISIKYEIQKTPGGISQAFLIGEEFINGSPVALILGDNLFYGQDLSLKLSNANLKLNGATLFAYPVNDPKRFGVVQFDNEKNAISIEEKPKIPLSKYAITGLYFYDKNVVNYSKKLKPSKRGELEITDLNNIYLKDNNVKVEVFGRGTAWIDTGTFDSLHEAGSLIKTLEHNQGLKIGYPEEVAWRMGWISTKQLESLAEPLIKNEYGKYLLELIDT